MNAWGIKKHLFFRFSENWAWTPRDLKQDLKRLVDFHSKNCDESLLRIVKAKAKRLAGINKKDWKRMFLLGNRRTALFLKNRIGGRVSFRTADIHMVIQEHPLRYILWFLKYFDLRPIDAENAAVKNGRLSVLRYFNPSNDGLKLDIAVANRQDNLRQVQYVLRRTNTNTSPYINVNYYALLAIKCGNLAIAKFFYRINGRRRLMEYAFCRRTGAMLNIGRFLIFRHCLQSQALGFVLCRDRFIYRRVKLQ